MSKSSRRTKCRVSVTIQLLCINIVTSVFQLYPTHRSSIIEDLFPIIPNLPPDGDSGENGLGVGVETWRGEEGERTNDNDNGNGIDNGSETTAAAAAAESTASSIGSSSMAKIAFVQPMTILIVGLLQCCVEHPARVLEVRREEAVEAKRSGASG